jgi:isopenicillin-N epimerase
LEYRFSSKRVGRRSSYDGAVEHGHTNTLPPPSDLATSWALDPDVVFLNHGSFGACPRAVLDAQHELRRRLESEPVRFFDREYPDLIHAALETLADVIRVEPEGLAFVPNATTGVNTALASFPLSAGEEVLTTDHAYNACRNALDVTAARAGATVVVAPLPYPLDSAEQIVAAILERVTTQTRLALVDHVTSQTGLVLPIHRLANQLEDLGVSVLVDGAHAPGMVDLDVSSLGASFYAGNCHKWLCAPKGTGFLWVREDLREQTRPLVISQGANAPLRDQSRFRLEFDWTGTQDPSPWFAVPRALQVMAGLVDGGWQEIRTRNRTLALAARSLLCDTLGIVSPCPESMIGAMATVPLPDRDTGELLRPDGLDPLQQELFERHAIEVQLTAWPAPPKRLLRISAQLYNSVEQFEYLAGAVKEILR